MHAQSVALTYRDSVQALSEVSFDIPPGQFVSIVGPSGCGKSTLLRLIAGLLPPGGGQLELAGMQPINARRKATRLSFVFQDPTLLPWRKVADNIRLPMELLGTLPAEQERRIAGTLELVGLTDFAHRYPNELSGGMRMRVSLARALVTDPQLLLLDEPFAALDDITRQTLNVELMNLWAAQHWTTVFVTHNIAEAVYLSQRVLVMSPRPGRIVADIPIDLPLPRSRELRSQPDFARLTVEVSERLRRAAP